jgi:signal transduction histidine kinase
MMTAVSSLAIRVLNGERAESIPVESPNLHVSQVDWRQLTRWGISESRVPAGVAVLFRQPTVFEEYRTYIFGTIGLVVLQTLLIGGLLIQRERRRRAEQSLRESNAQIQDLAGRLISAQEAERSRIARELHDDVGQQMALLAMDLELLRRGRDAESHALANEVVARAQNIATSLHNLSHRLHPATLRLIGLLPALRALRNEQAYAGLAVDLTSDNVPTHIPPDVTLCLFRITQEALQNAMKHSGARNVSIHLSGESGGLALEIVDDGIGFEVETVWRKGLGLISMTERVEAIGGRFEIRSKPGSGTRLHITVPEAALQSTVPVPK